MASTYRCLYSVGPNAIGPGVSVSQSLFSPQRNGGVVTHMYQDDNGIAPTALAGLYTIADAVFPGTAIPLDYVTVKQLSNNLALVVARYGSSSGQNGFKRVMTRTPSGYRQANYYEVGSTYTRKTENYIGPPIDGRLRPEKILTFPLMVVRWSTIVYQDIRPNDNQSLIGKFNSNSYIIDGYSHAAKTLRFEGTEVAHDKWGAYDRWHLLHTVTYDPRGMWRDGAVNKTPNTKDGNDTWLYTLANNGDGIALYEPSDLVAFPNLP